MARSIYEHFFVYAAKIEDAFTKRMLLSPTLSPEPEKEEADCIFSWQLASSKTGARGGNRTRMSFQTRDFKSPASTIPPPGRRGDAKYHWETLKTKTSSVAKLRLADFERATRCYGLLN